MRRTMFSGKIHRAVITQADVDYEGSVTVDAELLEAAGIVEFEQVHVWNVTRGSRLVTYALSAEPGSGVVCINGAAARLNEPGDVVILAAFGEFDEEEARRHVPRVVRVDRRNRIVSMAPESPGPSAPRAVALFDEID